MKVIEFWKQLPIWIRNRYSLTFLVFVFWMLFFDQNDMISQLQLRNELSKMEQNRAYYKVQIQETRNDLEELLSNDEKLEKFAREKYLMKKDNEVIFVLVEE